MLLQLPRVPMQGLNNVVPPQDPDNIALLANFNTTTPVAIQAAADQIATTSLEQAALDQLSKCKVTFGLILGDVCFN